MCGINGVVYFSKTNKTLLNKKIDRMAELTKHRGPDASAKILFNSAALNENRLAIIAPEDKQVIKHQMNRLYPIKKA